MSFPAIEDEVPEPRTELRMGVLTCAYCHHPVSEHYGRWCRVRTGAVNILGQELICCCQGADSVATRRPRR